MADYNSNYTGAEVDAAIAKTQALESATDINNAIAPTSAAAGDVWTADGAGGAAWVTPSGGGGTQLYQHYMVISGKHVYVISKKNTPVTDRDSFYDLMVREGIIFAGVNDGMYSNGIREPFIAMQTGTTHTYYYLYTQWNTSNITIGSFSLTTSATITDTVTTL